MLRLIGTFLLIFMTTLSFAEKNEKAVESPDLSGIRNIRNEIAGNIQILKEKNVDLKTLSAQVQRLEKVIGEIEKAESVEQQNALLDLTKLQAENLLRESKAMVVYTKRLDLLYLMMASFGGLVILSILIYTIIMYTRRSSTED